MYGYESGAVSVEPAAGRTEPTSFRTLIARLPQDPSIAAITAERPGMVETGSVNPTIHCYITVGTRSRNRRGELSRLGLEKRA